MKKLYWFPLILLVAFSFFSCDSSNGGGSTVGPGGIGGGGTGGGGTGNVTIQVQGQNEEFQGQNVFMIYINPSVGITLQTISADGESLEINSQFQAGQFQQCFWVAQNSVPSGTQVAIRFQGTITDGGQNFDVTTNYTVP